MPLMQQNEEFEKDEVEWDSMRDDRPMKRDKSECNIPDTISTAGSTYCISPCLLEHRPPARLRSAPRARYHITVLPLLVGEVWMNSGLRAMRFGRVSRHSRSPRASLMKMVRPRVPLIRTC